MGHVRLGELFVLLVIGTAIFPHLLCRRDGRSREDHLPLFLGEISTTAAYTFVVAASFLTISIFTPYLSALAEIAGNKRSFMRGFVYRGIGLYGYVCIHG